MDSENQTAESLKMSEDVDEFHEQLIIRSNSLVFGLIINPLLSKLAWSSWLDIGLVLFLHFCGLRR